MDAPLNEAALQLGRTEGAPRGGVALVTALAFAFAAAVAWATAPYGPGGWHFAMNNIAAADHLLAGEGLIQSRGNPFLSWPPLMPALIAAMKSCGLRYVEATWWIAIASAFVTSYFHGRLLLELSRRAWVAAVGLTLLWIAPGFFRLMCSTLSQPLFIALSSAGAWTLVRWTAAPSNRLAVALGLLGMAASLHRYDGLVFIPVGALVMVSAPRGAPLARRVGRAALVAAIAAAPLLAWLGRNRAVSGSWTGERVASSTTLLEQCADVALMARVALAPGLHADSATAVLALVLLAAFAIGWAVTAIRRGERAQVFSAFVFPVAYGAALIFMASRVEMDRLSDRLAAPLTPPLVAAAVLGLSEAGWWSRGAASLRRWGPALLCGGYTLIAVTTRAGATLGVARELRADGAGGFASARWLDSELARWLRANPVEGAMFSNAPEAVLLGADRMPQWLDGDDFAETLDAVEGPRVLILSLARRRDRRLLERVAESYRLTAVVEFAEAGVYRVEGRVD